MSTPANTLWTKPSPSRKWPDASALASQALGRCDDEDTDWEDWTGADWRKDWRRVYIWVLWWRVMETLISEMNLSVRPWTPILYASCPAAPVQELLFEQNRLFVLRNTPEQRPAGTTLPPPEDTIKTRYQPAALQKTNTEKTLQYFLNQYWFSSALWCLICPLYYAIKLSLVCFFLLSIANICKPT